MPNTSGTPRRTVRVSDALWYEAAGYAAEEGKDMSTIVREALERYVRRRRKRS